MDGKGGARVGSLRTSTSGIRPRESAGTGFAAAMRKGPRATGRDAPAPSTGCRTANDVLRLTRCRLSSGPDARVVRRLAGGGDVCGDALPCDSREMPDERWKSEDRRLETMDCCNSDAGYGTRAGWYTGRARLQSD
ncbi:MULTISPECIES: hypothetical protein [Ralstonia solanacearum species complex]|uniref:hypothetical protein n=2 Tax=Ralstonia pseudosolanacearum TaxID=1310165 RepID=UPI000B2FD9F4|nr:hypothetical protein FUT89_23900 [Ralstonia pseudosolanacearum]